MHININKKQKTEKEYQTFSGKARLNTMKTLAVIDRHGKFIWIGKAIDGRTADRSCWTQSDLYMDAGDYFSPGERLASDGGFKVSNHQPPPPLSPPHNLGTHMS